MEIRIQKIKIIKIIIHLMVSKSEYLLKLYLKNRIKKKINKMKTIEMVLTIPATFNMDQMKIKTTI